MVTDDEIREKAAELRSLDLTPFPLDVAMDLLDEHHAEGRISEDEIELASHDYMVACERVLGA